VTLENAGVGQLAPDETHVASCVPKFQITVLNAYLFFLDLKISQIQFSKATIWLNTPRPQVMKTLP
jgi:hypothetical protein